MLRFLPPPRWRPSWCAALTLLAVVAATPARAGFTVFEAAGANVAVDHPDP